MFGKTHSTKTADVEKKWLLIDAKGLVVGRLATIVAMRLRGKHKPSFTPHIDDGDNVIVVNAEKVVLTGRKRDQKVYYHYTGFIGGIKERTAKSILDGRYPERVVVKAVERMLPRGPAGQEAARQPQGLQGPGPSARGAVAESSTSPSSIRRTAGAPDPWPRPFPPSPISRRRRSPRRSWKPRFTCRSSTSWAAPTRPASARTPSRASGSSPARAQATVNGKALDVYFARPVLRMILNQPLVVANRFGQYDLTVTVAGGGLSGQAGAVRHGLAKALTYYEPELRGAAEERGLPHPRLARRRAQEVRPRQGAPQLPRRGGEISAVSRYHI